MAEQRTVQESQQEAPQSPRSTAFRVLAVLTALWVLARVVFGLLEVGLMWFPYETIAPVLEGFADSAAELEAHRSHFMSIGLVAWAFALAVIPQVRRPHRREAQMAWAVVLAVGSAVVYGRADELGAWLLQEGTLLLPILALAVLHPRARNLVRPPAHDRQMLRLAAVAAVPWLVFAAAQVRLQWRDAVGDVHAEPEHWASVALMAVAIAAASFIGAGHRSGWRVPAWFAVVATILWAVHSLVFPAAASAAPTGWVTAAILWALVLAAAILRRPETTPV